VISDHCSLITGNWLLETGNWGEDRAMARARISIIGLGLVGASLGLAIRQAKPELEVVGHDASNDATKQALKLGAIEKSEWNLINACATADLLILATPALAIKEIFELTKDDLKDGVVVTDTAGSKGEVMRWAQQILPSHVSFVGGDPLVGVVDGNAAPRADLFKGQTYCISPAPTTPNEAVQLVVGLVDMIGATAYFMDPVEHDGYVGAADHLPFVLSAALLRMMAASDKNTGKPDVRLVADMHRLIGPTFRRSASFSSEDPKTYRDLCLTNRDSIVRWIGEMRDGLDELSAMVQEGDSKKLGALFEDVYVLRQAASRPYLDPDQESQSTAIRTPGAFGIGELLGLRRRVPPEKDKGADPSKGR
jgi:prephenate dehydrogenase